MQISKKTLATVLIGLAAVIGVVSIFCFFGSVIKLSSGGVTINGVSMFKTMFGDNSQGVPVRAGMTVLFVIEIIILLLSITIIAGNIAKKLKSNTTICFAVIIAILTLIAVIMSFCTKSILDVGDIDQVKLGAGPVSYSVLGIIGIISNVAGIIVAKKA